MTQAPTVSFYLHQQLLKRARAGKHNFIHRLASVLTTSGFTVEYRDDSLAEILAAGTRPDYSVVLMQPPINARGVTIRLNYVYPFWHIQTVAQRWEWPAAKAPFDAETIDPDQARKFVELRRRRLFKEGIPQISRDGYVLVPLQGKLLSQRSFQSKSPVDMLRAVLAHDPNRKVIATLHPGETYDDAELQALDQLEQDNPRLKVELSSSDALLAGCDYVVTENSAVALRGFFLHKPAALFALSDFHHITANAMEVGETRAIQLAPTLTPDFDRYLWWFLQKMSINAGSPEAEEQIRARLMALNWPL